MIRGVGAQALCRADILWIIRFSLQAEAGAIGLWTATVNSSAVARSNCTTASKWLSIFQTGAHQLGRRLALTFVLLPPLTGSPAFPVQGPSPDCAGQG